MLLILSPLLSAGGLEQRLLDAMDSFSQIQSSDEMEDVMAQAEAAREPVSYTHLHAPVEGAMKRMIRENLACRVHYQLIRKGKILLDFTDARASFEADGKLFG